MRNDPLRNPFCLRNENTESLCFYGRRDLACRILEMVASERTMLRRCGGAGRWKDSLLAYPADRKVQAAHYIDSERALAGRIDLGSLQSCSPQELWFEMLRFLAVAAKHNKSRWLLDGLRLRNGGTGDATTRPER